MLPIEKKKYQKEDTKIEEGKRNGHGIISNSCFFRDSEHVKWTTLDHLSLFLSHMKQTRPKSLLDVFCFTFV